MWPSEWDRIAFCRQNGVRDFPDETAMSDALVDSINEKVKPGDTMFFLGDMYFGRDGSKGCREFLDRIACDNVYAVWGNHDKGFSEKDIVKNRFRGTGDYGEITVRGQMITLFHYRISEWDQKHRGAWNLHGHSHGALDDVTLEGSDNRQRCLDVGVDMLWKKFGDIGPVSFEDLEPIMSDVNVGPVSRA
jgi:calcineurin-like phosphoesterase family protein